LSDPAEYVLTQKKEHADLGVPAGQQPAFEVFLVGTVVGNQAGQHEGGLGVFQQGGGRDAFIKGVQDERWQFPHPFAMGCCGK
jgi:hypothetical protein